MIAKGLEQFGKKAMAGCLTLALSVMMVPAVAFAADPDAELFADGTGAEDKNMRIENPMTGDHDFGVYATAENGNTTNVNAWDVAAKETGVFARSRADDEGKTSQVNVTADSIRSDKDGMEIRAEQNGNVEVTVNGDVTAAKDGVNAFSGENGKATVTIDGDVTATHGAGLLLGCDNAGANGKGSFDILITGTLKGATSGVDVSNLDRNATDANLTVWKIEAPNGNIVAGDENDAFAKSINYIIRLEEQSGSSSTTEGAMTTKVVVMTTQAANGVLAGDSNTGNLRATDANGNPLAQSHGYDVAHEGDTVFLTVEEGYEIVKAYSSGVLLTADENGNYSIVVPRGGGVNLSVIIQAISAADDAAKDKAGKSSSSADTKGMSSWVNAMAKKAAEEGGLLAKTADTLPVLPAFGTLLLACAALAISRRQLNG